MITCAYFIALVGAAAEKDPAVSPFDPSERNETLLASYHIAASSATNADVMDTSKPAPLPCIFVNVEMLSSGAFSQVPYDFDKPLFDVCRADSSREALSDMCDSPRLEKSPRAIIIDVATAAPWMYKADEVFKSKILDQVLYRLSSNQGCFESCRRCWSWSYCNAADADMDATIDCKILVGDTFTLRGGLLQEQTCDDEDVVTYTINECVELQSEGMRFLARFLYTYSRCCR